MIHQDNVQQAIQIVFTWVTDKANLTENLKAAKAAPLFNMKPPSKYTFPCKHPGCQKGGNNEAQLAQHMAKCPCNPKNGGSKRHTKGRGHGKGRGCNGNRGHGKGRSQGNRSKHKPAAETNSS